MEAPPQFPGAPKKSKTGCILGGIALVIVLCCCGGGGALYYFGRGAIGKAMDLVGCSVSIEQHRAALVAYAAKHGGKLPPAAKWQDDVKAFVKPMEGQNDPGQPFTLPGPDADYCDASGNTGLTYNRDLAGKKIDEIKEPYEAIVLFETPGRGRNKSGAWQEQPFASSPQVFKSARRGWLRQPLKGQASYKDQLGRMKQAPTVNGGSSVQFGN